MAQVTEIVPIFIEKLGKLLDQTEQNKNRYKNHQLPYTEDKNMHKKQKHQWTHCHDNKQTGLSYFTCKILKFFKSKIKDGRLSTFKS